MSERWTQEHVDRLNAMRGAKLPSHLPPRSGADQTHHDVQQAIKPSKYRNVKTMVGSEQFDSKREADYWILLKARQSTGEITDLRRQVDFPLYTPELFGVEHDVMHQDSIYRADYTYRDAIGGLHVVDAKGHRTREYALKAKRLFLQQKIAIEEV